MTEQYLSLKQAQEYTGKSRSSLRRFVESITKVDNHPDRKYLEPSIERVIELHAANHPFSWRINRDLLDREFKQERKATGKAAANESQASDRVVTLLEETVSMLNSELAEKNKQISLQLERLRETNILLQQTTEKLVLLTSGRQPTERDAAPITVETRNSVHEADPNLESTKRTKSLWRRLNAKLF